MAISYNIVMSNRKRYPLRYVCFGLLNKFQTIGSQHFDPQSPFYKTEKYHGNLTPLTEHLVAVEYNYLRDASYLFADESVLNQFLSNYRKELLRFLRAFPWIKPIAAHNKKLGVVRVKTKGVPADKVMFVLAAVRNLLERHREMRTCDQERRDRLTADMKRMPSYAAGWIYSNLTWSVGRRDWSQPNTLTWESQPRFNDESNLLNSATFGRQALKRLLSGEEPEWYQDNFDETYNGYQRDSHFEEFDDTFGTEECFSCEDEYYSDHVDGYCSTSLLYRTMADSVSIEYDDPIFSNSYYDSYVGFVFEGRLSVDESIEEYLSVIKEF